MEKKWRHIKVFRLAWFCHEAPPHLRWKLGLASAGNRLEVAMPRGKKLDFKLTGGAWIRPQEADKKD